MNPIEQQQWQDVTIFTWGELLPHQWMDFRTTLMDTITEIEAHAVAIEISDNENIVITEFISSGVKIVQSPIVMSTRTEMVTSIVVSDRDYYAEMIDSLPLYERKSKVFQEILIANDREFRNNEQLLQVVERNIFLDTAIESLAIHERDLSIESVKSLRYDQRREQISSRYRAAFDQTTEETIKTVASAYSNGDVEVNKTDTAGIYEIKFIGTRGVPDNIEGLKKALDIIIPAHLGLTYVFTFTPWSDLQNQTWGDVADETWDDLRMWEGAI